jgi:hypothetical protein
MDKDISEMHLFQDVTVFGRGYVPVGLARPEILKDTPAAKQRDFRVCVKVLHLPHEPLGRTKIPTVQPGYISAALLFFDPPESRVEGTGDSLVFSKPQNC